MGRIEKVIVLTVLMGVILILGFSTSPGGSAVPDVPNGVRGSEEVALRDSGGGLEGVGPRRPDLGEQLGKGADPHLASEVPADPATSGDALAVDDRPAIAPLSDSSLADSGASANEPGGLLSSDIEVIPAKQEAGIPAGSALISIKGLTATSDDSLMTYSWTIGDNFAALSERFYGHVNYVALLKRANEGHTYFAEGDEILVPVFDRLGLGQPTKAPVKEQPAQVAADGEYVVVDGDSLWIISKKTLGKGHRWREIYQLNLDRLPSSDAVRPGMVLRIPTDG